MKPQLNAIYSFTNGFGFTTTIRVVRFNDKVVVYNKLLDDSEWGQIELKMNLGQFSIYTKIS
jgi:hypothetical protein